jgi:hypothetical protein
MSVDSVSRCRDSILYRLILGYFTAHDHWASQHNITVMCRTIPHIMHSFPAIMHQTHDTFPHSCNAFLCSCLVCVLAHLCVLSCIFTFHCNLVCIITGASIHCPASSLVSCIPIITISDYAWHHTIIISLWTLTLPHILRALLIRFQALGRHLCAT